MSLSESDTRAKLIDPALHERQWTEDLIKREESAGSIRIVEGSPVKEKKGRTDYILRVRVNHEERRSGQNSGQLQQGAALAERGRWQAAYRGRAWHDSRHSAVSDHTTTNTRRLGIDWLRQEKKART